MKQLHCPNCHKTVYCYIQFGGEPPLLPPVSFTCENCGLTLQVGDEIQFSPPEPKE